MLREGCKVRKKQVFGGWEMLLFESYLGEPFCNFSTSRYLIDFITSISDVSSGLAPLDCDPCVDSNSLSDQDPQTNRRWPTMRAMRANFRMPDQPEVTVAASQNAFPELVGSATSIELRRVPYKRAQRV